MGRYISWDDVVVRYPSVEKFGGALEVGSAYLGSVEAQIDGMLASHYTVPFSSNNVTVKDLCVELLYARIGNLKVEESSSLKDEVMTRIENLKNGKELMITTSGDSFSADVGDVIWSSTQDYHPVFGHGSTSTFVVDSSQIYDEEQARE